MPLFPLNLGGVTSVAMTVPGFLSVSGSPITASGTIAVSLATQTANTIFAGPTTGAAALPTFRSLIAADMTMASGKLLGRSTAGSGAVEEIALGSGLTLSAGTLTASGSTSPAGSNTQLQYNSSGSFGASSVLTYTTNQLKIAVNAAIADSLVNALLYIKNSDTTLSGHASVTIDKGGSSSSATFNLAAAGSGKWDIGMLSDNDFCIHDYPNNIKAFRIDSNRNTYILKSGTAVTGLGSSESLAVQNSSSSATNNNILNVCGTSGACGWWLGDTASQFQGGINYQNSSDSLELWANAAIRMRISSSGSVRFSNYGAGTLVTDASGNITASSDERLKDVNCLFNRGLDDLRLIRPISYRWKKDTGLDRDREYSGFSAQNIMISIPEAIGIGSDGFLTIQDRPIIATLVNAVNELRSKIEDK